MKSRFDSIYNSLLVGLVVIFLWSIWAQAQPATNFVATNVPVAARPPLVESNVWLTFGLDQIPHLDGQLFSIPMWQYLGSVIYIFLALWLSRFVDWVIRAWLKRWAAKTATKFDDLLLELLRGPLRVVTFMIFLHVGLRVFVWPVWIEEYLAKGLKIVVAVAITYLALKLVDLAVNFWRDQHTKDEDKLLDDQLFPFVKKAFKAFVIIVATLVTAQNLNFNITGLLASLSIGGLALGLAAQDTVANLFGAVAVLLDKPFRVGDVIRMDGVEGTVETIGLRSTRVRSLDGFLVTVPNKTMGNATITNVSRRPNIRTVMDIGLTYDTPAAKVDAATKLLAEIFRADPNTHDLLITFDKLADSSLNIRVIHWWNSTDMRAYHAQLHKFNLQIKERFDAAGLGFAFPSRTVYVRQDSEWKVAP